MRRRQQFSRAEPAQPALKQRRLDERRGSSCGRGYDRRWRSYRERFLAMYPFCIHCQHIAATIIDHILPVAQDGSETSGSGDELFWPNWNHQPLCRSCHQIKSTEHDARLITNRRSILSRLIASETNENARRNELLQRAEVWDVWIDLETGEEIRK